MASEPGLEHALIDFGGMLPSGGVWDFRHSLNRPSGTLTTSTTFPNLVRGGNAAVSQPHRQRERCIVVRSRHLRFRLLPADHDYRNTACGSNRYVKLSHWKKWWRR